MAKNTMESGRLSAAFAAHEIGLRAGQAALAFSGHLQQPLRPHPRDVGRGACSHGRVARSVAREAANSGKPMRVVSWLAVHVVDSGLSKFLRVLAVQVILRHGVAPTKIPNEEFRSLRNRIVDVRLVMLLKLVLRQVPMTANEITRHGKVEKSVSKENCS